MYRITRQALRNANDTNPITTFVANVDCTEQELGARILHRLRNLAKAENLQYKLVNSSARVRYVVAHITAEPIDVMTTKLTSLITHHISKYNEGVNSVNKLTRRSNKVSNRPADTYIVSEADLKEYLRVPTQTVEYKLENSCIIIEDDVK